MSKITKRTWTSQGPTGKRVRHTAYGYTFRMNGRRHKRFSSEWQTETAALGAMLAHQEKIKTGHITPMPDKTLAAVVEEYLTYKRDNGKRSLEDDEIILRRKILPAFGAEILLRKIAPSAIAQYERDRSGKVKPGTIANELSVLRHLLRLGRRWGYLDTVPEIVLPKRSEGRLRYLELDEIARLLEQCKVSRNPHLWTIVVIALNTGMRQGEILGLEWERVDLASARITVYKTKSSKPKGVPINRPLYDALVALEPDPAKRQGFLFRNGEARWGKIRTAFELALKRAGIVDFTFHDLRHTFASHAIMRGVTLPELKEILGHSTLAMTLRYAHLSPTHLRSAVEKVEGITPTPATPSTPTGRGEGWAHKWAHNTSTKLDEVGSPR